MKIFGLGHLLYLAIFIVLTTAGLICAKKFAKTEKSQNIIMKCIAIVLLLAVLANRLSFTLYLSTKQWYFMFPDQYCSMSGLVLSLTVLFGKKDNNIYHFVWFLALLGGILTMIYPDFIRQNPSFFYPPIITGLLHHSLEIVLVIMLLIFKQITITYKKWYCSLFGFTSYLTFGAFLINVLHFEDAFHIKTPFLYGTPYTIWVIAPMYVVLYSIVILTIELVRKRKNKQLSQTTQG